jgi:hypothetical protein
MAACNPKSPKQEATIGLFLKEIDLNFNTLHYLGTVKLKT